MPKVHRGGICLIVHHACHGPCTPTLKSRFLSNNMFYRLIQRPGFDGLGNRVTSVVHLDTMGIAGENFIPKMVQFHNSLDAFQAYHVTNKYMLNDY